MYAIVKTGGKQYRVEQGQSLVIERLPGSAEGDTVDLAPLLYVDGDSVVDGEDLGKVSVSARILGHERGPKLRVVKFKPKRGYKRRTGHRQELTRIEVTQIKLAARKAGAAAKADGGDAPEAAAPAAAPKPVAARKPAAAPKPVAARKPAADKPAADKPAADKPAADKPVADNPAADKPAADKPAAARKPRAPKTEPKEDGDGA
jgi:large subunit ribosomal protein L21